MAGNVLVSFRLVCAVGAALYVTIRAFALAYFGEHLASLIGLAHHTNGSKLVLFLLFFIRHLRIAGWTVQG